MARVTSSYVRNIPLAMTMKNDRHGSMSMELCYKVAIWYEI